MKNKRVKLVNEAGLHARPASMFVKEANKFKSDVEIAKGDKRFNGKSIMGILSLGVQKGEYISIETNGEDENLALEALVELVENGFCE
ncbi:HPr family phosphocarrier protein [Wukongibacter sp. M2B1]|uniref:HPr family phosphocarrier protein n=1 Tax=Wukongibacter sp. M2B1 TaxID=3088895 RepID=UPI003D7BFF9C